MHFSAGVEGAKHGDDSLMNKAAFDGELNPD